MICLLLGIMSINAIAVDDSHLFGMLAAAATNRGNAYLEARAQILALGTNALPELGRYAIAADLTWQQRLAARICYEKLTRGADIDALMAYDWRKDKNYDKKWEQFITGPSIRMGAVVVPKCREFGLWYYYVELTWKETNELPVCGKCLKPLQEYSNPRERQAELERRGNEGLRSCVHQDGRFRKEWPNWCLQVFTDEPEKYWRILAISERMIETPFSLWHYDRYLQFIKEKDRETVPLLVQLYDARTKIYPSNREDWYREGFLQILEFADSRHADLLEKFISEKPALEPLKKRLAEVRARPAPSPVTEPPFRLGKDLIIVK
jgi:hypothetical protein